MHCRSWWWRGIRNGGAVERKIEGIPRLGVSGGAVAEVAAVVMVGEAGVLWRCGNPYCCAAAAPPAGGGWRQW